MVRRDGRWHEVDAGTRRSTPPPTGSRATAAASARSPRAKATNEDGYVIQKLCRVVMGTNNVDHCTRLCHSPSVEAMLASMGSGATSNSYQDYEEAGCLMVVGADASANHPVIADPLPPGREPRARGSSWSTPSASSSATRPTSGSSQRPGTDVALFNAMARVILDEGLADLDFVRARTEGFEAWRASLEPYTLEHAEAITGVPAADIAQAARWYARPPFSGSCLIWGMGITQHINGTANAHALLNLVAGRGPDGLPGLGHLAAPRPEQRPGLRRRRLHPDQPARLSALRRPRRSTRFERAWGVRPPAEPGLVVTEMVEGVPRPATIRAMYVVGENPLLSEPDLHHAEKAIDQLDFLVVQDLFMHETAELRPRLPARRGLRREGRHLHQLRAARAARAQGASTPPGQARPDWWITSELAKRVARRLGVAGAAASTTAHPSEIFDEMARLMPVPRRASPTRGSTRGRAPVALPDARITRARASSTARRFPRGKGALRPGQPERGGRRAARPATTRSCSTPAACSTTGTAARSPAASQGLLELAPRLEVAIHPADARRLGVDDGRRAPGDLAARRARRATRA